VLGPRKAALPREAEILEQHEFRVLIDARLITSFCRPRAPLPVPQCRMPALASNLPFILLQTIPS
jgi:hypothetical protein